MARPEFRMSFADAEALARELDSNLRRGRAFLQDVGGIAVLSDCTLVLVHPASGRELSLQAQAVMVSDSGVARGIGLELRPFDREARERIERFARDEGAIDAAGAGEAVETSETGPERECDAGATERDAEAAAASDGVAETGEVSADGDGHAADGERDRMAGGDTENDAGADEGEEAADAEGEGEESDPLEKRGDLHTQARIQALRTMSHVQRQKIARAGELQDRVLLERLFGRDVWPQLLLNPKLTLPEVARIARKRTVPRPLLQIIIDNNAWIQASVVRRALLSNPRIGNDSVDKLIRITPKHELKLMGQTLAYSAYVRDAARRALKKEPQG